MLRSLSITNYALIEKLTTCFEEGFSVITGETGAGKSILLGALGFLLGDRADSNVLFDKEKKCIVEAEFWLNDNLRPLFESFDLDFDNNCIFRRELTPQKKTRAFINDTVVNLQTLKEIGSRIVDIHSQHDSLLLTDNEFRTSIIDSIAGNKNILTDYKKSYDTFCEAKRRLESLTEMAKRNISENDYLKFQLNELIKANISEGEYEENEQNLRILENSEEINNLIFTATSALEESEPSIISLINDVENSLERLSRIIPDTTQLAERTKSAKIELKDISYELNKLHESYNFNEKTLLELQERQDILSRLMTKHNVESTGQLFQLRQDLQRRIEAFENIDKDIEIIQKELSAAETALKETATSLHQSRVAAAQKFGKEVRDTVKQLAMPHAVLDIVVEDTQHYTGNGSDEIRFLFSANKGIEPTDVQRVASGGELSRLMLSMKNAIAGHAGIPTLIFDEIDTGVSGEVAAKIGDIMVQMGKTQQIIAITHLPQVASKASNQYLIYKDNLGDKTKSNIRLLNREERISEIAKMLSNDKVTNEAINAAEVLLKS